MAALLALTGALGWGVGDFLGGLAARRLAVLTVLALSQVAGLAGVLVWVLLSGDAFPGVVPLLPAAAAGIAAMVGLGALYRGLAIGAMGIVAPISAAAPVIPLTIDVARGDVPGVVQWLGVALVVGGIVVLSREPHSEGRVATGAGLAIVAAVAFGLFFVGIDAGSDESSAWAVTAARAASAPVAVAAALLTRASLSPGRRLLGMVVAVGVFDTTANVFVAAATTYGAVGIVAVLGSLYPIVTIVLARVVLGERLGLGKRVGGGVALAGAALVAAG